jgi:hypothetical protein
MRCSLRTRACCSLQVGYRASKEAFGQVWEMSVAAGAGGPIFSVSDSAGVNGLGLPAVSIGQHTVLAHYISIKLPQRLAVQPLLI